MLQSILIIGALLLNVDNAAIDYKVDAAASTVKWKGEKVTGSHTGTINLKDGKIQLEDGKLVGGSFTIDMTSIVTDENNARLEGHLKSEDFFGVEKFPTSTFVITSAVDQGPRGFIVTGDITIKGTTKEIKFKANVTETAGVVTATADLILDRSDFDIRYGSSSFFDGLGDKIIYDEFSLSIALSAKK